MAILREPTHTLPEPSLTTDEAVEVALSVAVDGEFTDPTHWPTRPVG